jgi:hypothetical protein
MKALNDPNESKEESSNVTAASVATAPEERRGLPRVRSGINISATYVEAKEGKIAQKEEQFK